MRRVLTVLSIDRKLRRSKYRASLNRNGRDTDSLRVTVPAMVCRELELGEKEEIEVQIRKLETYNHKRKPNDWTPVSPNAVAAIRNKTPIELRVET